MPAKGGISMRFEVCVCDLIIIKVHNDGKEVGKWICDHFAIYDGLDEFLTLFSKPGTVFLQTRNWLVAIPGDLAVLIAENNAIEQLADAIDAAT